MSRELKLRWITALVAIAVVAWGLFSPSVVPLYLIALVVAVVGCWEASRLVGLSLDDTVVSMVSSALLLLSGASAKLVLALFSIYIPFVWQGLKLFSDYEVSKGWLFPLVYVAVPLAVALYMKATGNVLLLIAVAACVWAGDAAAYFAGRRFGRTPLNPVSPKKTVEGAVAGLVVGTLAFFIPAVLFAGCGPISAILFGLLVNASGQLGDLFESYLKRKAGVKDSGSFFPGHGGVLDRVDSLLFALVVASIIYL